MSCIKDRVYGKLLTSSQYDELLTLRRELHRYPEQSDRELETAARIIRYSEKYRPDSVIAGLGGNGVAFVYNGCRSEGCTVLIRAELDALPLVEKNRLPWSSETPGVAHLCGHDGHAAILAGMMPVLNSRKPEKGKVILLFQPAEETGMGADAVLQDAGYNHIRPDYVFALHNLPGFPLNQIVISNGSFASASRGMIIGLEGRTSHAAEPEKGVNPAATVCRIIGRMLELPCRLPDIRDEDFALITVVGIRVGGRTFGTSAGEGEICLTLRAGLDATMQRLAAAAEEIARTESNKEKLSISINYTEVFPAVVNDSGCAKMVAGCAAQMELPVSSIEKTFRWSEDFGHFTARYKGALFGIGAGVEHPALHSPVYDFPDQIIGTGISMLYSIISSLNTGFQ